MIYFDNAATGGFKPYSVTETATTVIKYLSANPGRSGNRLSLTGAELIQNTRKKLAEVFNASPEKVIFTKNCTEALNLAILGSVKFGGHVITTVFEHNSILRPLYRLKEKGIISLDVVSPEENKPFWKSVTEKINDKTYLIACTLASNVTGEIFDVSKIGEIAKQKNILLLADGAQAGGHIETDIKKENISMLALAGHKGLYGIMGCGVLILDDSADIEPLITGGTGTETFNLNQPLCYPEKLESGTLNLPAIASLNEGVDYIYANCKNFAETLYSYTDTLIKWLSQIDKVKIYSKPNKVGIVAFEIIDRESTEIADILNTKYDVAVRAGFHCAPLMHNFLGTDTSGLVRVSLAVQNSIREINYFVRAIKDIIY